MKIYTSIYGLLDPRNNKIRYVGKSNNPEQRLRAHCTPARYKPTHKFNWIKELREKGLKPILIIIEKVLLDSWKNKEKYWIRYFTKKGYKLTNYTDGGDGLTYGNQTSFKKGNKSWNEGKGNTKICVVCGKEFLSCKSAKKKSCSTDCGKVVKSKSDNSGKFSKGSKPWNTGLKGRKLKPDKNVHQYSKDRKTFIKTWNTAMQAQKEKGFSSKSIGQCARKQSKSSGQFWWTYNKIK